jgi:glycosyltransferase involved in cell wall biosynthesis
MPNPKFSIVVPTRQRPETLKYTLDTCLAQRFDDYEIVVCDNCSSPPTKQLVDGLASPRIRYHRAAEPLSMQDNWNLAYDLSRGDWITFIGDDDGIMPFGLRQLDNALKRHDVKAIRSTHAVYSWPTIAAPELANYLQICLLRGEQILDGRTAIKDVMSGRLAANQLPNVYHSTVSREVLEAIKQRTGAVFRGFHPDTYTSFAVAYLAGRYLSLTIPITVSGFSAASNNIAFSFLRRKHAVADKQRAENAAHEVHMHPWIPDMPSLWSVLGDSFLLAKSDLFPDDKGIVFDRKIFAERMLRDMPIDDVSEWPAGVAEIRRSLADDPGIVAWFDKHAASVQPSVRPRDRFRPEKLGYLWGYLHIDAAKCGVQDVAGATRLAAGILDYDRDDLSFDLPWLDVAEGPYMGLIERGKGQLAKLLRR